MFVLVVFVSIFVCRFADIDVMRAAYINQKNLTTDRVKCDVKTEPGGDVHQVKTEPDDDVHQVKIEVRTSSCVFVALHIFVLIFFLDFF